MPLTNPSFEQLSGTDQAHFDGSGKLRPGHWVTFFELGGAEGFTSNNAVPGWEGEGANGTAAPLVGTGPSAKFGAIPNGQNPFFGSGSGVLFQTLNVSYSAGNRYVFTVMVGRPLTAVPPAPWVGGDLPLLRSEAALTIGNIPSGILPGEFRTITVEYSVAAGDPVTGKKVGVAISAKSQSEVDFDAATLSIEPIQNIEPEIVPAVRLSWPTTAIAWYQIKRTPSLTTPQWTPVATRIAGRGKTIEFFEAATNAIGYYRIIPVLPH